MPGLTLTLSEERDVPILRFLWLWKVATTAALGAKFFGGATSEAAYRRLMRLKSGGFVDVKSGKNGSGFVWTLDRKGFALIRERLPELRDEGYKSESLTHDLLTSAFHLGDWLVEAPERVEFFTEQELRRYHDEFYPDWVPKTSDHRPDGYWNIPSGEEMKTLALEVELSHQRTRRYQEVFHFYERHKKITSVLWLVPSVKRAKSLEAMFLTFGAKKIDYHQFVTVSSFQRHGWLSLVEIGLNKGKMVSEVLSTGSSKPLPPGDRVWMLETRKSPHHSISYLPLDRTSFCV